MQVVVISFALAGCALLLPGDSRPRVGPRSGTYPRCSATSSNPPFCLETATLLAGFAFESYNQPELNWEKSPDGTRTGLLSPAFIREYYDGVLAIDSIKANLFRPPSLLPLQPLDTFVVLQVGDQEPIRSETARGTETPQWEENQVIYVKGAAGATLVASVYFENPLSGEGPQLLGRTQLKVDELRDKSLSLWGEQRALSGGGRLELKAQFIEFGDEANLDLERLQGLIGAFDTGALANTLGRALGQWRASRAVAESTGTSGEKRGSRLGKQQLELTRPDSWFGQDVRGPMGAAGVDWSQLAGELGGAACAGAAFEACCFVENPRTNTQCGIWRQQESKTLIISFRGTQQDQLTDIITDISLMQRPATRKAEEADASMLEARGRRRDASSALRSIFEDALAALAVDDASNALERVAEASVAAEQLRSALQAEGALMPAAQVEQDAALQPRVHTGFYAALDSVLPAVIRLVRMCTADGEGWTVLVTGHSLGGALATLCSWEIEAQRALELPNVNKVSMYNFGSPRVGNTPFADSFDASIPEAFRVVNDADIVARVPRTANISFAGEWQQVGRTVMVQSMGKVDIEGGAKAPIWVEGEDPGGCPLLSGELSAPKTMQSGSKSLGAFVQAFGASEFVQRELEMMKSVFGGQGIADHLEDAYYAGMAAAVAAWPSRAKQRKERTADALWDEVLQLDAASESPALLAPSSPSPTLASTSSSAPDAPSAPTDAELEAAVDDAFARLVKEEIGARDQALSLIVREELSDVVGAKATVSEPPLEQLLQRIQQRAATEGGLGGLRGDVRAMGREGEKEAADAAAELEGAIKKEVERFISVGEWNMQDLSLLLRIVLLLGGSLTPAASLLPVRMLVSIYGSSLASELGERLVQEIASRLQQRLSQGISDSVRAGGQLSKQAVSQITGKEDYEFGDITKSIGKKLFGGKGIF